MCWVVYHSLGIGGVRCNHRSDTCHALSHQSCNRFWAIYGLLLCQLRQLKARFGLGQAAGRHQVPHQPKRCMDSCFEW
ncbi:hypothetical protein HanXRQr2_Chr17g0784711 [Helianthus annuus]|uniref:Uncharacterized protein n=1 Tax=Helianthus annuus TaxID=4232 RepID=A0A9K3DE95_HELAN|nr:hypothetical protein HanXRQr2_Chr17g0784711 [Helianthus annuus]KAJ0811624.1 hypothetical protein HanPSC8_Chr17g0752731 [Helianthus annuus]